MSTLPYPHFLPLDARSHVCVRSRVYVFMRMSVHDRSLINQSTNNIPDAPAAQVCERSREVITISPIPTKNFVTTTQHNILYLRQYDNLLRLPIVSI